MNVVVIEDEPPSAEALADLLAAVAPGTRLLARIASGGAAVGWLSGHSPPDLVFADIELRRSPEMTRICSAETTH